MIDEGGVGIACRTAGPSGNDARAADSRCDIGILEAHVPDTAAEDSEEALVVHVGVLRCEVADDVSLTVKVDEEEITLGIRVQRCPVLHLRHVEVVLQYHIVHLSLVHVLAQLEQVLYRIDDEGTILGASGCSQCGQLVREAVSLRIDYQALLVEGGIGLAGECLAPERIVHHALVQAIAELAGGSHSLHVVAGIAVSLLAQRLQGVPRRVAIHDVGLRLTIRSGLATDGVLLMMESLEHDVAHDIDVLHATAIILAHDTADTASVRVGVLDAHVHQTQVLDHTVDGHTSYESALDTFVELHVQVAYLVVVAVDGARVGHIGSAVVAISADGTEVLDVLHVNVGRQAGVGCTVAGVHILAEPAQVVGVGDQVIAVHHIGDHAHVEVTVLANAVHEHMFLAHCLFSGSVVKRGILRQTAVAGDGSVAEDLLVRRVEYGISVLAQCLIEGYLALIAVQTIAELARCQDGSHLGSGKDVHQRTGACGSTVIGGIAVLHARGGRFAAETVALRVEGLHDEFACAEAVQHRTLVCLACQYAGADACSLVTVRAGVLHRSVHEAQVLDGSILTSAEETGFATILDDDGHVLDDVALSVEGTAVSTADAHSVGRSVAVPIDIVAVACNRREVGYLAHVNVVDKHGVQVGLPIVRLIGEPYQVVGVGQLIHSVHLLGLVATDHLVDIIVLHPDDEFLHLFVRGATALEHHGHGSDDIVLQIVLCLNALAAIDIQQGIRYLTHLGIEQFARVDALEDAAQLAQHGILLSTRGSLVQVGHVALQLVGQSGVIVGSLLVFQEVGKIVVRHM